MLDFSGFLSVCVPLRLCHPQLSGHECILLWFIPSCCCDGNNCVVSDGLLSGCKEIIRRKQQASITDKTWKEYDDMELGQKGRNGAHPIGKSKIERRPARREKLSLYRPIQVQGFYFTVILGPPIVMVLVTKPRNPSQSVPHWIFPDQQGRFPSSSHHNMVIAKECFISYDSQQFCFCDWNINGVSLCASSLCNPMHAFIHISFSAFSLSSSPFLLSLSVRT